jgi:hypothetical protein
MKEEKAVGHICVNKAGKAHIPVIIRKECAAQKIPFVINANSVLLFNPSLDLDSLLESIDVLRRDVKLRYGTPGPEITPINFGTGQKVGEGKEKRG